MSEPAPLAATPLLGVVLALMAAVISGVAVFTNFYGAGVPLNRQLPGLVLVAVGCGVAVVLAFRRRSEPSAQQ